MTVKSEVQGVVQALFGAYAGGYLAELTAEATANGTGAVAARLASVQGIILGRDLTSNATFINTILGNLGVNSLNPAYAAAAKWATDAMAGGATRADVVTSAVAFLEGVAAGTIVDAAYSDIAKAYAAKVAAGVKFSETAEGSKVLSVADLRDEAGAVSPSDVSSVLAGVTAANKAVADFLAALDLDKDGAADGLASTYAAAAQPGKVDANVNAAEIAVDTVLAGKFTGLAGTTDIFSTQTVFNAEGGTTPVDLELNGQDEDVDAAEDANGVLIAAQNATQRAELNAALNTAILNLPGATAAARAEAKAAADAYVAAAAAATAATTKQNLANIAADTAAETWNINTSSVTSTDSATPPATAIDVAYTSSGTVTLDYKAGGVAITATYAGSAWAYTAVGTTTAVVPATYLSTEVKTAAEALYAAGKNSDSADAVVTARLADTGVTSGTSLAGPYAAYAQAAAQLTQFDAAVVKFNAALAAVTAARTIAADLAELEDVVVTTTDKLKAAGYTLGMLDNLDSVLATSKSNLYDVAALKNASIAAGAPATSATVTGFGSSGDDALIVTGWTKAATAKGDNNVLEFSIKQVASDTVVSFENKAFGLSDSATAEFTVTLVGVDSTTLSFADGLIVG